MRSEVIRVYKSIHTWTGIVAGMALFIAFYAGALTIFKEPLSRWVSPPSAGVVAVPLQDTPALINHLLSAHPEAGKDFHVYLKQGEHIPARIGWEVREASGEEHDHTHGRHYMATLQADGTPLFAETEPSQLADFIDVLHRVVGLPFDTDPNRWVMGVIAILYALALISGVVIILPSLLKDLFALRLGHNLKRMWRDAHNVVGLFSLPFHIIMAVTAGVFAFHDGIYAVQNKLIHDGQIAKVFAPPRNTSAPTEPRDPTTMLSPEQLLAQVHALSPTFQPDSLQYLRVASPAAMVRVWGHDERAISPRFIGGFVALDPYSARVLNADNLPGRQDAAFTTLGAFFGLHFGTYGGAPVQWLYFVLGMAGAWLFYSGNLLWIESRRKSQRQWGDGVEQRKDVTFLAAATVGICLGAVVGISSTIVAGKWLHGHVTHLDDWYRYVYYSVFFASIAWAFAVGGARASVHLLWLAAASTLAIPLTTLSAYLLPSLGLWVNTSGAALGVDATALVGSLGFMWMARATQRRVWSGPRDSVWSARQSSMPGVGRRQEPVHDFAERERMEG